MRLRRAQIPENLEHLRAYVDAHGGKVAGYLSSYTSYEGKLDDMVDEIAMNGHYVLQPPEDVLVFVKQGGAGDGTVIGDQYFDQELAYVSVLSSKVVPPPAA